MRVLLEAGASVEEVDADKTTVLQWICKQGHHAKCAEALISRKADINVLDKISYSLLALVAKAGASANAPDLMRLLLANGANVNAQTKSKTSPLAHYAYYSKELGDPHDAEIVRILVEAKADVNARNKYSNSAQFGRKGKLEVAPHFLRTALSLKWRVLLPRSNVGQQFVV